MGYFTTPKTYSFLQGLSWELLLCSNQLPNLRVCRNQTKCLLSSPSYQPIKTSNKTCVQALQPCHPAVLPRNLCQVAPAAYKIPQLQQQATCCPASNRTAVAAAHNCSTQLLPQQEISAQQLHQIPLQELLPYQYPGLLPYKQPAYTKPFCCRCCLQESFTCCCTKIRTIPAAPILRTRPLQQNQNQETAQLLPLIPIFPCPAKATLPGSSWALLVSPTSTSGGVG